MCGHLAWTNQNGRNKQAAHKNLEAVWHAQGTTDFKWHGWSNDGKNQNPKKSLGLPTVTPPPQKKSLDQKSTSKKSHPEFLSLKVIKIFQKAVNDKARKIN